MWNISKFLKNIKEKKLPNKELTEEQIAKIYISQDKAYEIACDNLKMDFCENSWRKGISYLGFTEKEIQGVEYCGRIYWRIKILDGEISQIEHNRYGETFLDGNFTKRELKKLNCLIDAETGEYIYFPNA